jgi:hypothetical protein
MFSARQMIVRARKTELVPKGNTTVSFGGLCLKEYSIGYAFVQLLAFGTGRGIFGDVAGGRRAQLCTGLQFTTNPLRK